jgi:putative ABC transport system permease protein
VTRLALRSLASRPLRTVLTTLAILLGVAMITGTYVLTDQINKGFADIFETSFKGTAVVVEPRSAFSNMDEAAVMEAGGAMDAAVLAQVREVPGVAHASGALQTIGAAIVDGKPVNTGGAPTLLNSDPGQPFNQATLVAGRDPVSADEVTIITSFADQAGLQPGDKFDIATPTGLQTVNVAGVFEWGNSGSLGGAIVIVGRLQDVQRWAGQEDSLSVVNVAAAPGVTPEELAASIDTVLPGQYSVKTGEQAAADATAETAAMIDSFLTPVLLAFAGVSVFVGAFIIFNAFSITVAQRRREFAMLRALGASRRQVLSSVVAEALALGLLASAAGIAAGLGVAKGINALFKAVGADIPTSGLVLEPRTVLIAVLVGVGVTLLSALAPALRATRVPPVAALQEGATLPPSRFGRFTTPFALLVSVLGAAALTLGITGDGTTNERLLFMGVGALVLFVAIAMLSKYIVRPVSRIVGWPIERLAPISGRLARDNAGRNPSRTAATAAALMIGLAMVVFVAVFAQALKGSFSGAITEAARGDLVIQDRSAFLTVPQENVGALTGVSGVQTAAGAAWTQIEVEGTGLTSAYAVDPAAWNDVWGFRWMRDGGDELLARLDARHVLLESESPAARNVEAGDTITVTTQAGKKAELTVLGFYRDNMAFTGMVTSLAAFERLEIPTAAGMIMVSAEEGADRAVVQAQVQDSLSAYPTQTVMTRDEYLDSVNQQVDQILTMFYGLLAMAVIISIFGIVNTLVLSVHERIREIGMLRAIGATRSQLRQMVRYESVITAIIGGTLGTAIGVAAGYLIVTELGGDGLVFSVPWFQLGVFLALAVVVGVVAAVIPARRAAATGILDAIKYE